MKVGLVGYLGSGKTTIFTALTGLPASAGRVHLGTMSVPDARIDKLVELYQPKKTTYAEIVCVDIPGRAGGPGEGLDSSTLEAIRDVNALALVIGTFTGSGRAPADEVRAFHGELILADQMLIERRLEKLKKEAGKDQEKKVLEKMLAVLESEKPLTALHLEEGERQLVRHYAFSSDRPLLVVVNVDERALEDHSSEAQAEAVRALGYPTFVLSAKLEAELADLDEAEQAAFLKDMGLEGTARDRFIRAAYDALQVITMLTAGEKEVHAWPIPRGSTAKQAAGKIHTDLERGFIRAEVFHFDDLVEAGSEAALKSKGKFRLEGKDYIVKDGDVVLIRHSG